MQFLQMLRPGVRLIVPGVVGFFLGRIIVFEFVSPFALAFIACWFGVAGFYTPLLLTLMGILSVLDGVYMIKYIAAAALMGAVNYAVGSRLRGVIAKAASASGAAFAAGLAFAAISENSMYFVVAAVVESSFVFGAAIVLDRASGVLRYVRRTHKLAAEEQISLGILAAAVIVGAAELHIGLVSLGWVFLCAIILTVVYKFGGAAGGAVAMLLGIALSVGGYANQAVPAVLGTAAIVAGVFRGGKLRTAVGFIIGLASTALFAGNMPSSAVFGAAVCGSAIFIFTPIGLYFDTIQSNVYAGNEYLSRVKTVLGQRLYGFSHSFGKLSRTFSTLARPQTAADTQDVNRLIDNIMDETCNSCPRHKFCWERGYYDTYRIMSGILSVCEKKNRISAADMPDGFRASCVNAALLTESINRMYEIYRLNMYWQNRMAESRALISEQLSSVAKLIQSLASELDVFMNFKPDLECGIQDELNKNGIESTQVLVLENRQGRYEVSIRRRDCPGRASCAKELVHIAGGVLGRRLRAEDDQCSTYGIHGDIGCSMRLVEEQKFRIVSGVACCSKTGSPVSGDSYSFMELNDGQALLALSDGMGSGEKAREESAAAVDLLEDFIESGFEKDMAVKMINSVLVLRNEDDCFSTLDICSIDLYTGYAEFVKIGAAATYLMRDGEVSVIKSSSLPIGMLNTVDIEVSHRTLKENDIIIMATDGVMEVQSDSGDWITDALSKTTWRSPQDIANILLLDAQRRAGGVFRDDMTVLAARMWQRS